MSPAFLAFVLGVATSSGRGPVSTQLQAEEEPRVPRRAYTFWHAPGPLPELVAAGLASLKRQNPAWAIRVLFPGVEGVELPPVDDMAALTPQQLSDWYRVAALGRPGGGGVWLDATTLHLRPLESWVDASSAALQGYYPSFSNTTMESWAFAVPTRCPLAAAWLANFRRALRLGTAAYCAALPDAVVGDALRPFLPYLAVYAAYAEARHQLPHEPATLRAAAGEGGPTHYQQAFTWLPLPSVRWLFAARPDDLEPYAFVKLRGADRACAGALESHPGSFLASALRAGLASHASLAALARPEPPTVSGPESAECRAPDKGYNSASLRDVLADPRGAVPTAASVALWRSAAGEDGVGGMLL